MSEYQNDSQRSGDDFHFEIVEHIAILGQKDSGWKKEVNIVEWNGLPAKVDIREWDPEHKKMSRGVTMHDDEARKLARALNKRYGIKAPRNDEPGSEPQPAAPAFEAAPASAAAAAPA